MSSLANVETFDIEILIALPDGEAVAPGRSLWPRISAMKMSSVSRNVFGQAWKQMFPRLRSSATLREHLAQGGEIVLHDVLKPVRSEHVVHIGEHVSDMVVPVL